MTKKMKKYLLEARSLGLLILIALLLKVTIVEAYIVPTGSMENTIMTGDFLIGNRYVYGMRTPDWVGIPYTDLGFNVPYYRFPKFREPEQGDVIIFKYPRDPYHKYVKRLIARPGDTLRIEKRKVFVNGIQFPLPENGKYVGRELPPDFVQREIFAGIKGNKDNINSVVVPKKGDVIPLDENTNWNYVVPLMIMDGHNLSLESKSVKYDLTIIDPNDLFRRKESPEVYEKYFPTGKLLNPWSNAITPESWQYLQLNGVPINEIKEYTVEQDYYWAMGDNRDDSLDSRFWGFVPQSNLLGEALLVYFSLNLDSWMPRLNRIGTVIK